MFKLRTFARKSLISTLATLSDVSFFLRSRLLVVCCVALATYALALTACITTQTAQYRTSQVESALVWVTGSQPGSGGTGFRFSYGEKTYIATASHVCKALTQLSSQIIVTHIDNQKTPEKILALGIDIDACILSDSKGGKSLWLDFEPVQFAESVYTLGWSAALGFTYGEGYAGTLQPSVYKAPINEEIDFFECMQAGVVPGIGSSGAFCPYISPFLATNIETFFGQSGSPLLNGANKVVGIASMTTNNGSLWTDMASFKILLNKVSK